MNWFSKLKSDGGLGNAFGSLVAQAASLIPEEFKDNDDDDTNDPTYIEPTPELIEYVSHLAQHPSTFTEFPIPRAPEGAFPLTRGQTRHARKMLEMVPSLQKLRYSMCPSKMNEETFWRIYFLLLLNKTNGKTNKTNDQKEEKEKSKGKSKEKDGEHGGSGGRRKERDEEREEGQDVDVLSEHALERYFEKLFFDYQQELFLATPEDVLHRHMKRKGDRYQLDDGIDPHEDNYFARPIRTRPQQPNQQTVA
ncbi:BSD domain containing protein [Acanthamoeba castellanii str. Neff]|uniref:BSD domain containing protein n=1 Tax=Acanthamoeba castellanii (strain ATCC 30010 / Neff) TaxID=1257118 RepID=L8H200_ACACF|nr:BSD domain containing protein [Acanthamoeba castellanii str. Neff]ELR19237.1 BSD domain containing protein [Acanthamoeba castellanii str. Neff]